MVTEARRTPFPSGTLRRRIAETGTERLKTLGPDPMALVRMSGADGSSDDTVFAEQSQLQFDFLGDSVTTGLTPS